MPLRPTPIRLAVAVVFLLPALAVAAPVASAVEHYRATDTFRPDGTDPSPEARKMLHDLAWDPATFDVTVTPPTAYPHDNVPDFATDADALVTFASPRPTGPATSPVNTVVLEWYKAKPTSAPAPGTAVPAVLVLHIMDVRLVVDRGIARTLAQHGINAFLMHLPDYGLRYDPAHSTGGGVRFLQRVHQGVADARRARDVIAALPGNDPRRISLDGTSLGGFVGVVAASLDHAFDHTFIMLAGGDLYTVFTQGTREAAGVRKSLQQAGYTGEKLRALTRTIDPLVLAHRLRPDRTWLYSARGDEVVPAACANALAAAAALPPSHHVWINGDHYTALLTLPWTLRQIEKIVRAN